MRAVITVTGSDKIGIIAGVTTLLAECGVNILDINQTIMGGIFTMIMMADTEKSPTPFEELQQQLEKKGTEMGVSVRIQREDVFRAMSEL